MSQCHASWSGVVFLHSFLFKIINFTFRVVSDFWFVIFKVQTRAPLSPLSLRALLSEKVFVSV